MLENYQALLGIRKIICWVSERIKPLKTTTKKSRNPASFSHRKASPKLEDGSEEPAAPGGKGSQQGERRGRQQQASSQTTLQEAVASGDK